jgi:hypothetical protein
MIKQYPEEWSMPDSINQIFKDGFELPPAPESSELPMICLSCDRREASAECPHCAGPVVARYPYAQATVVSMQTRLQSIAVRMRSEAVGLLTGDQEDWVHGFLEEIEDMLPVVEAVDPTGTALAEAMRERAAATRDLAAAQRTGHKP